MTGIFFLHFRKFKIVVMRLKNFYSEINIVCDEYIFVEHRGRLIFYALFNNAFNFLHYVVLNDRMTVNLKGCGRKRLSCNLKYYSDICLDGLGKNLKPLSNWSLSWDLNPGLSKYVTGVRFWCEVWKTDICHLKKQGGMQKGNSIIVQNMSWMLNELEYYPAW